MVRESHVALEKRIAKGELDPFQEVRDAHKNVAPELSDLQKLQTQLQDPALKQEQRETLSRELFKRLQPIGNWLVEADSAANDASLTPEQYAEYQALSEMDRGPGLPEDRSERLSQFQIVGPGAYYTLQHLSVPIIVQTEPETPVFFESPNGGRFSNGMTLARTVADENGIARIEWVSKGSAAGTADVVVSSPVFPDFRNVYIHVVGLDLGFLPAVAKAPNP